MKKKLKVPPPPGYQSVPTWEMLEPRQRRSKRRRAGLPGCVVGLLAVLLLLLVVVAAWQCALVANVPALIAPQQGGRTNLLLVGIDRRGGEGWTYRTDTIIVVSADARTRSAAMLSIPRDLQLPIPTHGADRINTANVYGDLEEYPGGGPALLEATVEANFDIPIDGYVMIDFRAFKEIVDALGGIDVEVTKPLHDTRYPDPRPGDPYAYKTVHFDAGVQHMDGTRALEYARSRMSTSDFDRARRQQQILLALRQKALRAASVPRWPALARTVLDSVRTDLNMREMASLALLAAQMDPSSLKQVVLEHPLVYSHRRADGAAIQLPNWDLIEPELVELFGPR